MQIARINSNLYSVTTADVKLDSVRSRKQIVGHGIHSALILSDDGPYPGSTPEGLWFYKRPCADPGKPSIAELYRMHDFIRYENTHGRAVGIVAAENAIIGTVELMSQLASLQTQKRPLPNDDLCCRPFRMGCQAGLVCHGTTVKAGIQIMRDGMILAKSCLPKSEELDSYSKRENVGDPLDYMQYVCLANGNCVSPELVIEARRTGSFREPDEVAHNFHPGVRFYFDYTELVSHKGATFDGIHPIKIHGSLSLNRYLVAVIAPTVDQKELAEANGMPTAWTDRIVFIDQAEYRTIATWSDEANRIAIENIRRGITNRWS